MQSSKGEKVKMKKKVEKLRSIINNLFGKRYAKEIEVIEIIKKINEKSIDLARLEEELKAM